MRILSLATARQLAITKQGLAGRAPRSSPQALLRVFRGLGCVQLDPISAVARSHLLVLRSRLAGFKPAHLDRLLWRDRALFEYWAHCASIVLTEDYPLHAAIMRDYPGAHGPWARRMRAWLDENRPLQDHVLAELERHGGRLSRELEDPNLKPKAWVSSGWNNGRKVSQMLDAMWMSGRIMVADRPGGQKRWDLAERILPAWTPREVLDAGAVTQRAAPRAVKALGVATATHVKSHFLRSRYVELPRVLDALVANGELVPVQVEGQKGRWHLHRDDLGLVDALEQGGFAPRTTLLSPFDNLICDRARTRALFGFDYTIEIYVPKHKREYGYYAMPVLHGDRLIGRVDPSFDRERGVLRVNALHHEPGCASRAHKRAVRDAVDELAGWLGATRVDYAG